MTDPVAPPPPPPPPVGMPRPGENVTQTNGLATASLVLGILSLVLFFTFVIAWVLGIPRRHLRRDRGEPREPGSTEPLDGRGGTGVGIAGLVVGILFIALITTSVHQVDHFGPSVQFCMNSRNC